MNEQSQEQKDKQARIYLEQACRYAQHPSTVETAAELFNKAIELKPDYVLAHFYLGTMFYEWCHYFRAIEPLKKAIELEPALPSYVNLGRNYYHMGRFREAEEVLRMAYEIDPNNSDVCFDLGYSIMMSSFYDIPRLLEASEYFRKSLDLNENNARAADMLGWVLVLYLHDEVTASNLANEIKDRFPFIYEKIRFMIDYNIRR